MHNNAGLPNITGELTQFVHGNLSTNTSGAFRTTYTSTSAPNVGEGHSYDATTFDASRCTEIYGNSNTVIPNSIDISIIIYLGKL